MNKKTIIFIIVAFVSLFFPFVILTSFDLAIQNEYSEFYYAELGSMYNRLKNVEGKKIVIIGNSNVSFGVESRYFEELLDDPSYTVVNFGLYGSIGTKAMLDLSQKYIKKDDIVIFVPEEYNQSMSLYFSATEMWFALDSNRSMFNDLDSRSKEALVGNYVNYVSTKYNAHKNHSFESQNFGVYAKSSFDERCDLTNYDREYNVMVNDYDENNPIDLKRVAITDDFIDYINEYNTRVTKKGAKMYYSFSPMNKASVISTQKEIDDFYNTLRSKLNFPIISDIDDYIMDKEWFYDSNFHLNTSGMKYRTVLLVEDLKNELGITTKTDFVMLDRPVKFQEGIEGEGDNSCADCFTYEKVGNYYKVTGLTQKGKEKEELVIPYQVDGLYISGFDKTVFLDNTKVKKITIQKNIRRIYDASFNGCASLKGVYLLHTSPSEISVGFNLLVGTTANIYVDNKAKTSFINDYFWGAYQERIYGYEKD